MDRITFALSNYGYDWGTLETRNTLTEEQILILAERERNLYFREFGKWLEGGGGYLLSGLTIIGTGLAAQAIANSGSSVKGGSGNSYPSSREDLHSDLINKGYNEPTTSGNGYVTYKHPNGNVVTIKPTGEVIPTVRLPVDPTNNAWNAPKYNQRTFYDGTYTDSHSTGHFIEPFIP